MKHKMFLTAAALVLLFLNLSPALCQTGVLEELDPNILWVADSTIGRIDGFAVHPNGSLYIHRKGIVSEINGANGERIRVLPKSIISDEISAIDISQDGKFLATSFDEVVITDLSNGISKSVAKGNLVKFLPVSGKIAYISLGGLKGSDSSIVILDLETNQRKYIKTEEAIDYIAFSPDGRFLATGGVLRDGNSERSITLKLWDANTLQFIRELDKIVDHYSVSKIQFSDNNRMVAFFGSNGIQIFDTDTYAEIKHYTDQNLNIDNDDWMTDFTFITNDYIGIQSEKTSIIRLSDDHVKNLFDIDAKGFIGINQTKDVLFTGAGYPKPFGSIFAWDLNKVFSSVENEPESQQIQAEYINGTLKVRNLVSITETSNMKIIDIQGKVIKEIIAYPTKGNSFEYRIKLNAGVYILIMKDGVKEYSSKFLVLE